MNYDNCIEDLLSHGESQELEFKKSLSLTGEGLKTLCGMINTDYGRGTVIFGKNPDGGVDGIEPGNLDTAQQTLSQKIKTNFDPQIVTDISVVEYQGKNLLKISATRSPSIPYHEYNGRAFIREGTSTRQLTLSEKQSLSKRRDRDQHNGPWRCNKCGSFVGQLQQWIFTGSNSIKSYSCECGGEYWPVT